MEAELKAPLKLSADLEHTVAGIRGLSAERKQKAQAMAQ